MGELRRCPFCNAEVGDGPHTACGGLFRELMSPAGDVPPEVAEAERRGADRIRQYLLVRLLGRGGMGEVWKAWDGVLARWVALKFVTGAGDPALFQREARMAARLRHPHIAAVYEVGDDDGRSFIAMDFVEGDTLAAAELPIDRAVAVFAAVTRAVEAAHRAGIIHRDLKPQNILLSRDAWPFVTDFGLARPIAPGGTVSATGSVIGTPAYMPPEQAAGRMEDIDERSDVYSLGATFYHVLCGQAPFSGEPLAILGAVVHHEPRRPSSLRPGLPAPLETIVLKAMSKSKAERYATAGELADDLDRFIAHEKIRGRIPGRFRRFVRTARGPAAGIAILVAGIVGAVWLDRRRAPAVPVAQAPLLKPAPVPEPKEPSLDQFVRALSGLASRADLTRRPPERFAADFAVPAEPSPAADWARACRSVLERLRAGEATERDLALVALQAGSLHPQLFASAEETAVRFLEERLDALTADLADAPRARRDEKRAAVEELLGRWAEYFAQVPPE
ncbi:MAG: serine/threonine protein kinase, partial [Planctomycetaceae bacterium]|nr:serine/threonine protein kinase [Planctomycetaceae bacterium]